MQIGDKVTYRGYGGHTQEGVVKDIAMDEDPFVVYNCGGDWENYRDYTGAKTPKGRIKMGWSE